jgi:hypothetical protein
MSGSRLLWIPLLGALALGGCRAEQTREGRAPEIEVRDEGQLPAFDIEPADVEIGTERRTVEVPTIETRPREDRVDTVRIRRDTVR